MEKGYVQIYTGNGKGKTTASIGLMVRAVGAGKRVYFGQFMKEGGYSEIKSLKERFPEIKIEQYGGGIILGKPSEADLKCASAGFGKALAAVNSGDYDLVVLDEINVAVFMELIPEEDVLNMIENKPESLELVLTGRYAAKRITEAAGLVSEIKEIKHYFNDGVTAREGIEM